MPLHDMAGPRAPSPARGEVGVLIAPVTRGEALARCMRALLEHTPDRVSFVIAATGGEGRSWLAELEAAGVLHRDVWWLTLPADATAGSALDAGAQALSPADVALIGENTVVGAGWLDGLAAADGTASATALSNDAAFASAPNRNLPWTLLPPGLTVDDAAERVRANAMRIRPRLPRALAHCALIPRAALDLSDGFDPASATADEAVASFSTTATACGLVHVLADDVLVLHRGGTTAEPAPDVATRLAAEDRFSALSRALAVASGALVGRSVSVDGRCLTPGLDGTRTHVLELIAALARTGSATVRVVVPRNLGAEAGGTLRAIAGIELVPEHETEGLQRSDVVHRPWQVFSPGDLQFLDRLGERTVLTVQDLIGYRTPAVFASTADWLDHRRLMVETTGVAAAVLFLSQTVADDAIAEDLVSPERSHVVRLGARPRVVTPGAPRAPAAATRLGRRPYLLCLGNRFRHKNLVFALRLLEALRAGGWDGDLAVAGAEPAHGGSAGDEAAFLAARPALADHVVELAAVSEAEKAWLIGEAAAVLYPSTVEGFGLVPFEAATAGTPCLYAPVSALAELLDRDHATLVPWDAAASAALVMPVLTDRGAAADLVAAVRDRGAQLDWDSTARATLAAYEAAVRAPAPAPARSALDIARVEHDYWALRGAIGGTALDLIGPDERLLDTDEQETLSAILRAPRLATPVRALLRAGTRARRRPRS